MQLVPLADLKTYDSNPATFFTYLFFYGNSRRQQRLLRKRERWSSVERQSFLQPYEMSISIIFIFSNLKYIESGMASPLFVRLRWVPKDLSPSEEVWIFIKNYKVNNTIPKFFLYHILLAIMASYFSESGREVRDNLGTNTYNYSLWNE